MRKNITVTFLILIALGSISYMLWTHISNIVYGQDGTKNNTSSLYELANSGTLAKILSGNLVNYLNESASILEITSMIPEVSNAQYADKINSSLHGISDSYDVEKRQIADSILKHVDTFEAITFLLPNGDMYMEEPTIVNYVSVEIILHLGITIKELLIQNKHFLGDVIVSSSTGEKVALISVPIYLNKDPSLLRIW